MQECSKTNGGQTSALTGLVLVFFYSVVKRYKTTISGKLVFGDTKTLADESCREEVLILEVFSLVKMTHEILPVKQNVIPTFV